MKNAGVRANKDLLERHFDGHDCDSGKVLLLEACRLEQELEKRGECCHTHDPNAVADAVAATAERDVS